MFGGCVYEYARLIFTGCFVIPVDVNRRVEQKTKGEYDPHNSSAKSLRNLVQKISVT